MVEVNKGAVTTFVPQVSVITQELTKESEKTPVLGNEAW